MLTFAPTTNSPVAMHYEANSVHYEVDGFDSDEEFAHLLPQEGHTIHLTSSMGTITTHTVTLFHQLKCLDIIRREYGGTHTPDLTQH
ncbi:hypothetical protein J3R30DRAFT_3307102 [Lentinula aciculospora]|nr:hypothetical protein J3R30DRAFT_3307102 [Lentinula aciculospora]